MGITTVPVKVANVSTVVFAEFFTVIVCPPPVTRTLALFVLQTFVHPVAAMETAVMLEKLATFAPFKFCATCNEPTT